MTPRRWKRLTIVSLLVIGVGTAAGLAIMAFQENMLYFFSPTQIEAGEAPTDHPFRLGGLVENESLKRDPESLKVSFIVTDMKNRIPVEYTGILPDLFREGQGVVALGKLDSKGLFTADEVLAKHDENYMPPEVADALKAAGKMPDQQATHPGAKTP